MNRLPPAVVVLESFLSSSAVLRDLRDAIEELSATNSRSELDSILAEVVGNIVELTRCEPFAVTLLALAYRVSIELSSNSNLTAAEKKHTLDEHVSRFRTWLYSVTGVPSNTKRTARNLTDHEASAFLRDFEQQAEPSRTVADIARQVAASHPSVARLFRNRDNRQIRDMVNGLNRRLGIQPLPRRRGRKRRR